MQKVVGAAALLAACLPIGSVLAVPVTEIAPFSFPIRAGSSTLQIPYDATRSLSTGSPQVERAVILLHGSSRSARNAYDTLLEAADLAGADNSSSLLVAPQFLIEEDIAAFGLPADRLFWSESGWKEGDASLSTAAHPRPAQVSSFAVIDSILVQIASLNPNLVSVVFAGHSAGGQFIDRFAAGSTTRDRLQNPFGIGTTYVVANPSSYLYLDSQRVVPGTLNQFAVPPPATIQSCPNYNRYKYGLQSRNTYMSQLSSSQIVARYRDGFVTVLLGEMDDDPAGPDLDLSCAAALQGSNRRERGLIHGEYLRHLFGTAIAVRHPTVVVPGVGHSSHDMFTSPCGVTALFGVGACDPVAAPEVDVSAQARLEMNSHPNPFRTETRIDFTGSNARQRTHLLVSDVRGRLVRTLLADPSAGGRGSILWDGRSNSGARLPAGVYFCRLQNGTATVERRVVKLGDS